MLRDSLHRRNSANIPAMKRFAIGLALMCPSVSLASGAVGVVWWALGGIASYLFSAIVLAMMLFERKIRWTRIVSFLLMGGVAWYWCSTQTDVPAVMLLLLLIVAPLLFLMRSR